MWGNLRWKSKRFVNRIVHVQDRINEKFRFSQEGQYVGGKGIYSLSKLKKYKLCKF